jgi:hypothetical protein
MLEGLNRVDWGSLTHAYGPAQDTPEQIRALTAPDARERENARGNLCHTLGHQGTRYTATAAAVPFLVELLDNPATPEKDQLIRMLVFLAVGYPERFLPLGIDPAVAFAEADTVAPEDAGPEHFDDYDEPVAVLWARNACEAVLRGADRFQALAEDLDAQTRQAAVYALAWFPAAALESVAVVRRVCRSAPERDEQANAILCLGLLGRYLGESADVPWLEGQLGPDKPYVVRITAAVSLAVLLGKALRERPLEVLLEAIQDVPRVQEAGSRIAWHCHGLIGHVCSALRVATPELNEQVLAALCRAVEAVNSYWEALSILDTVLELVFPDQEGVRFEPDATLASGQRVVYRDPTKATAAQRAALEALARSAFWKSKPSGCGPCEELLWAYGLPMDLDKLRGLLAQA